MDTFFSPIAIWLIAVAFSALYLRISATMPLSVLNPDVFAPDEWKTRFFRALGALGRGPATFSPPRRRVRLRHVPLRQSVAIKTSAGSNISMGRILEVSELRQTLILESRRYYPADTELVVSFGGSRLWGRVQECWLEGDEHRILMLAERIQEVISILSDLDRAA